jgi:hypothetical protein
VPSGVRAETDVAVRGDSQYARCAIGVCLAFLFCWVRRHNVRNAKSRSVLTWWIQFYFDADSCKVFVHALRYVIQLGLRGKPELTFEQ